MTFSKKLVIFSWAVTLILTALTVWFSFCALPLDGLMILAPMAWTETGAATGFYLWKAKNENRAKYGQQFIKDYANELGAETALRMAEIVLKD